MRLIDADRLLRPDMIRMCYHLPNGDIAMPIGDIEHAPAVDAAPVKHGRWEGNETCDAYDIAGVKAWAAKRKCSICGFTHKFIEAHMYYEFCPKCGARMDLEEQDAKEKT